MKRILLFIFSLSLAFTSRAQHNDDALAMQLVTKNTDAIGLSKENSGNYIISSSYYNQTSGTQMVYLLQSYKGLPVFNQMLVLAFKDEKLVSKAGSFLDNMEKRTNFQSPSPVITADNAVRSAITESKVDMPASIAVVNTLKPGKKFDFGKLNFARENVIAELMWVPADPGKKETVVKLAWEVQIVPARKDDYWNIRVDATNNMVIDKNNFTVYDMIRPAVPDVRPGESSRRILLPPVTAPSATTTYQNSILTDGTTNSPSLVGTVNYTVIRYPAESPIHPGGAAAMTTNPWTLAGGNAVSLGWHNDGTLDYTTSRGNNVHAHEDVAANNSNNGIMATSTTSPDPLNFNFPPNYTVQPTTPAFQQFAITNLFYWNNILHDITYKYGFDEPAGNFQNNNQGRGGLGNDKVQADAQDGSGTNNANFSTPVDGVSGRMQMYLFSPPPGTLTFVVNAPPVIAGPYNAVEGAMSTNNLLQNVGPKTGQVVYYNDDAAGTTHYACNPPVNSVTGKVAMIVRGFGGATCTATVPFTVKVKNAQDAGAIAVIMVNNVTGPPIVMGGTDNTITIPAIMISDVDGATIAAQLANNVNITMSATAGGTINLDGDIDNGIIAHEFFHGVSNRLTGGPGNSSCLNNAEEGGEGWSDYNALMLTTDWSTALITDGFSKPRPLGTYAIGQPITGGGIRLYPYCTNIAVNPLTYANMGVAPVGTEVHNIGEIWCMAVWEMTWALIQTDGINPNLFNNAGAGGNSVGYKLVMEGLKLQPCSPGYIDARNAILQADQNLYGGAHYCTIWAAFAKRGMGYSASQGSSFSATDQTPATDLPPAPTITVQPVNASVCIPGNATFSVTATGPHITNYQWQESINGGTTWTNITNGGVYSGATTATLTLTNVVVGMNNYQYRCGVTGGCVASNTTNSNAATLTIATTAPVINTQPANTTACAGTNATFTVAATGGTLTYLWQESTNGGGTWNNLANGGVYSGVTTATLTLTGVTAGMNNYQYRCIVTGGCNGTTSVNSNAGILTITANVPITITLQPTNTAACAGSNASFTITATGNGITYNWQVSTDGGVTWTNLSPVVTTPTLTLSGVTAGMNNNQYRCQVNGTTTCSPGSVNSNGGILTVNTSPLITTQPANTTICAASTTSFTGAASGTAVGYQWQESTTGCAGPWSNIANGGVYSGATTGTLTITGATVGMSGYGYRLVATGTCAPAANSNCATLTVIAAATITTQPANATVCTNSTATFTGAGSGSGQIYQWQVSTNGGTTWNNVTNVAPYSGATTGTLTINPVALAMNAYMYRLQVSNATCTTAANSNGGILTVNALPNVVASATSISVCTGTSTVLSATGANTYTWVPAGTGTGTPVTVTPIVTTTYTVTGTVTATGCTNTSAITITATPKPTVTLTASPYTRLLPYISTTLTATASSPTTNNFIYTWSYAGPGPAQTFAGNTKIVKLEGMGTYTVVAADASNPACASLTASITIADSASSKLFIYPSPNNGLFTVAYYDQGGVPTQQGITIYDSHGARVYNNIFNVSQPYQLHQIDLRRNAAGIYYVVLRDANGKRIKTGEVVIR